MACPALQNFKSPEDEPPFADTARGTKNDIGGLSSKGSALNSRPKADGRIIGLVLKDVR